MIIPYFHVFHMVYYPLYGILFIFWKSIHSAVIPYDYPIIPYDSSIVLTALPYVCCQVMASMHRLLRFALEQDPGKAETPREETMGENVCRKTYG